MEAEINALGQNPETPAEVLVAEILELATIAREHMGDRDRAAELLHQALGVDPMHEEALARYVDHFRERRDWRGLIDLYEFALDNARESGAPPEDLVHRLEEIAQLAELRIGDIDRSRRGVAADRRARAGEREGHRGAAPADRTLEDVAAARRQPRARARHGERPDPADQHPQEDGADLSRAADRPAPRDRALRAGADRESRRRRHAQGARRALRARG